ncbi:hypothetical protein M3650_29105 [Paenibacillus sp. MER TA 81-3]|uniref:hypothetical protein n=1 Tax=Paenibacillus sp. MER TA 81-3 TaxID=2939573 RepID=UPI00203F874E|nr:hypothetical protein [Paenibacillus sp. MER TA 81-3]MCM3342572.1 hypothetical protein [Paenibacillus sp. MER TA 81-3]
MVVVSYIQQIIITFIVQKVSKAVMSCWFYHDCKGRISQSSALSYLQALLPFFTWLDKHSNYQGSRVQWSDPREAIRVAIEDYLMNEMSCKVKFLRFGKDTVKRLNHYINTERKQLDPNHWGFDELPDRKAHDQMLESMEQREREFNAKRKEKRPESEYYSTLQGKVDDNILDLQDVRGVFLLDKVNERNIKYFINQIMDMPWCNHLLLYMLVNTDRNLDPRSIELHLQSIHSRMRDLFQFYSIQEMRNLNQEQQSYFEQFLFPMPSFDSRDFSFGKLAKEQAQNNRKDETDAIVPYLPEIRATARFRWSQMKRLRDAFYKAIEGAQKRPNCLPLEFSLR